MNQNNYYLSCLFSKSKKYRKIQGINYKSTTGYSLIYLIVAPASPEVTVTFYYITIFPLKGPTPIFFGIHVGQVNPVSPPYCYVLTFWPGQKCHSRWCTVRKWHILMAVMRRNRVGRNWLMKWDEVKKFPWYTHRPMHRKRVTGELWWRSNMRFQRSSRWLSGRWTII